jgi:copper chaperone
MEKAELRVEGMRCGHCKMAVEKALGGVEGISGVKVELENKKVLFDYDPSKVNLDNVKEIIEDEGYEVKS